MSNTDSFITEVSDEVRRDKLFALFRRYGWIAVVAVVLIVAGAAYAEWRKLQHRTTAQAFGDALMAGLEAPDAAARQAALAAVPSDGNRAAVLAFMVAADAVETGDSQAAIASFARIAADDSLPESYRQLASLKRVLLAGPAMDAADRSATLETLARPGQPFRSLALEQQAVMRMETGETDAAVALLRQVLQEPDLTAPMRRRATDLMVALGADPEGAAG